MGWDEEDDDATTWGMGADVRKEIEARIAAKDAAERAAAAPVAVSSGAAAAPAPAPGSGAVVSRDLDPNYPGKDNPSAPMVDRIAVANSPSLLHKPQVEQRPSPDPAADANASNGGGPAPIEHIRTAEERLQPADHKTGFWGKVGNVALAVGDQMLRGGGIQGAIRGGIAAAHQAKYKGKMGAYGDYIRLAEAGDQEAREVAERQAALEAGKTSAEAYKAQQQGDAATADKVRANIHWNEDGTFSYVDPSNPLGGVTRRPVDATTGQPYTPVDKPQYGDLPGQEGYTYYDKRAPWLGAHPIPGSPIPANVVQANQRAELAQIDTDNQIEAAADADPNIGRPDVEVPNPERSTFERANRPRAIDEARRELYTPEEQTRIANHEVVTVPRAELEKRFDALPEDKKADYYNRVPGAPKPKVMRGDTTEYKNRRNAFVTSKKAERDQRRQSVQGAGRANVPVATAAEIQNTINQMPEGANKETAKKALAEFTRIDADPAIKDKDAAKRDVLSKLGIQ